MNYFVIEYKHKFGKDAYYFKSKRTLENIKKEWDASKHRDKLARSWEIYDFEEGYDKLIFVDLDDTYMFALIR